MGRVTSIAWCHHTFNGWIGCTENGPECDHCYAREQNKHWKWNGGEWGPGALRKITSSAKWREPLRWNAAAKEAGERRRVFAFSLADIADAEAPAEMYPLLWAMVEACGSLDWLCLTKRPHRIREIVPAAWRANPPKHVWWGTSVGTQATADAKTPHLLRAPAAVRFLSMEPLLEAVNVRDYLETGGVPGHCFSIDGDRWHEPGQCKGAVDNCRGCCRPTVDWIIVGGESGGGARPCALEWIESIRDQCRAAALPCFVKQLGACVVSEARTAPLDCFPAREHLALRRSWKAPDGNVWAWRAGLKDSHGGDPAEWPEDLRIRQFPEERR